MDVSIFIVGVIITAIFRLIIFGALTFAIGFSGKLNQRIFEFI
jgi:hypothetical protein